MFSGIGGFELGIQRAFDKQFAKIEQDRQGRDRIIDQVESNVLLASGTATLCVGFSEVNKYAIQCYEHHFKGHKNYGGATRIIPEELPDFDFLCGGFPCQAFSIAGKRGGFDDTRGTLFFEIARILKVKRPRMFLLENVKGLLSHDNGRTFKTIITTLVELGYGVEWQVLNSKDFGVPQNRERVFIVGHLGGECAGKVFPITGSNPKNLEQIIGGGQGGRVYRTSGTSTTIASQAGGQGAKTGLYAMHDMRIRRLTPTECERLQGFPDGWTSMLSDSQRYKCLGNAVTVNVIEAIVERILLAQKL